MGPPPPKINWLRWLVPDIWGVQERIHWGMFGSPPRISAGWRGGAQGGESRHPYWGGDPHPPPRPHLPSPHPLPRFGSAHPQKCAAHRGDPSEEIRAYMGPPPKPTQITQLGPRLPLDPIRNARLIGGIRSHLVSSNFIVIGPIFRNLFGSAHPQKCAKHQGIRSYLVSPKIILIGPVFEKNKGLSLCRRPLFRRLGRSLSSVRVIGVWSMGG